MDLQNYKGKRVLIMGLGLHGGGAGAAAFFARRRAKVLVTDLKNRKALAAPLTALRRFRNIAYHLDGHRSVDFRSADLIVKNPGVPDNSPFLAIAKKKRVPVFSDVEIFFLACPVPIIGVTGTKGKSTTVTILAELLRRNRSGRVHLAGNIRKSVLDILPKIKKQDRVVLELSSFQLDSLAHSRTSPHIAVITNIFPDHLNRYRGLRDYALSKAQIFRFQKKEDYLFIPKGNSLLARLAKHTPGRVVAVDVLRTLRPWTRIVEKKFPRHQYSSLALAAAIAEHCGISRLEIGKAFVTAKPLEGRLEVMGNVAGVSFINDTTATNPDAAIAAFREIRRHNPKGGIVLIAGGSDKKLPVAELVRVITAYAKAVVFLPGETTEKMKSTVKSQKSKVSVCEAKTMQDAVQHAYAFAEKGDTVLLSPGAASFGLFENEFDRGTQFVRSVRKLKSRRKTSK